MSDPQPGQQRQKVVDDAYNAGYQCGRDTSGMVGYYQSWPLDSDLATPGPISIAYQRGYKEGFADRDIGFPVWLEES